MKAIRYLSWALRAVLFLLLLLFALKNTEPVTLRFFFSESWQLPLVLLLLIFFAFGAALGLVACTSRLLRERREILRLRKEIHRLSDARAAPKPAVDEPLEVLGR
jgi:lipopolysaccharide assembly protein A